MKLTKTLREAFVNSAMNDVPSIDYGEMLQKAATADAVAQMPPAVAAVYESHPDWIVRQQHRAGSRYLYIPMPAGAEFTEQAAAEFERIVELRSAQREARSELRAKINAAANSVTTRKALVALLPEFEKYLPADDRTATLNLPAVANIMAEFVKAGWPKGQVPA